MTRIVLDVEQCQGYASCVVAAPTVFTLDDDEGKAVVLLPEFDDPETDRVARAAAMNCPVKAIKVEE